MATQLHLVMILIMFISVAIEAADYDAPAFNRSYFGEDFVFGTASAAYQYEGAYNLDGKQPNIWDTYTHQHPERIKRGANGDVAVDQYHLYKEDVALMKETGLDAYRFSISWSRVMNYEHENVSVNRKGIQYYNNLINELVSKGLQPYVTLIHFDVPQQLEDKYGGFLNKKIVSDFQYYAEVCFKEFGDRVKHWITMNEPYTLANHGYNIGIFAPARCSKHIGNCTSGNSAVEPYIVSHNMLLAHAAIVHIYKKKFQAQQKGIIGITLSTYWFEPYSKHEVNTNAAQRAQDFMFGWYMDPITFGEYPMSMKQIVQSRLPKFSKEESDMLTGSYDFLGLNYYTAIYVANLNYTNDILASYGTDSHAYLTTEKNGIPIGPPMAPSWLYMYPKGFRDLLVYVKQKYNNPLIYITENGIGQDYKAIIALRDALNDTMRIDYYGQHLIYLLKAMKEKVNVKGFFAWSLLDNFEWADGYTIGFGINYVDKKTMKRYPKKSSIWFKKFLLH